MKERILTRHPEGEQGEFGFQELTRGLVEPVPGSRPQLLQLGRNS